MRLKKITLLLITATALTAVVSAQTAITFDFEDSDNAINGDTTLGDDFKAAVNGQTTATAFDLSSIFAGLTLTVTPSQSDISNTNDGLGLDTGGTLSTTGDALTFSFNQRITLDFLDFALFEGTGLPDEDSATLNYSNSNPSLGLTGANLNAVDAITLSADNGLLADESFSIEWNDGSYTIQGFNITVVPEPSTYGMLAGLAALGFTALKRRKK